MIHKANASNHKAHTAKKTPVAEKSSEPIDGLKLETTVTFGNGGIQMGDLAKCMTKKADGGFSFDFSNMPGVTITRED